MADECSAEVLAAAGNNSPCFDISEFLGSPRKDGVGSNDEVFSNLSGLNLSPSSFSILPPFKSDNHEPDLSSLLLDDDGQQQQQSAAAAALEEIESQLQAAAAAAAAAAGSGNEDSNNNKEQQQQDGNGCGAPPRHQDSDELTMFASAAPHDMNLVNATTSSPGSYYQQEARLLNYPQQNHHHHHHHNHHLHHRQASSMFGQHGSFLAEGGDNMLGGAASAAAAAGGATTGGGMDHHHSHHHHLVSRGDVSSFPPASAAATAAGAGSNACDWGVLCEGPAHHHHHVHPATHNCDLCQILRCIIHSNGVQDTKLEIHGFDNVSYHAVLHTRFCIDDGFPTALEQQMVEFPVGNGEYVRQFLLQYSLLRRKEGFVLRHDSMSAAGVDQNSGFNVIPDCGFNTSGPFLSKQIEFGSNVGPQSKLHQSGNEQGEPSAAPAKPPKSNAAAQRERTGKLKMTDLAQHFHLPINAAAKELGICPTVLKKICRRNGMRRWPHRKIKSIERIIATLEQTIAEGAGQGDEGIRMEIAMLRNERAQLCAGLLGQN